VGGLHGGFDVLRIVIAAANDDQILAAAVHEQLAVQNEAEVTSAEIGSRIT
jgi:hypothetical protein